MLALAQLPPTLLLIPFLFIVDNPQPIAPALPWVVASGVLHIFYIFSLGAMYAQAGGSVSVVYPVARGSGVAMAVMLADPLLNETLTAQAYAGIALVIAGVVCMGFSSKSPTLYRRKLVPQAEEIALEEAKPPDATVHPLDEAEQIQAEAEHEKIQVERESPTGEHADQEDEAEPTKEAFKELEEQAPPAAPRIPSSIAAIAFALLTGVFICSYSIVDKIGVGLMNPVHYEFVMLIVENMFYVPYHSLSAKRRAACKETFRKRKIYCLVVGIGSMAAYFIILYAFTLSHASYIVALRECAVVWGAWMGVLFLKEPVTLAMLLGTATIVAGVVLMKTAS